MTDYRTDMTTAPTEAWPAPTQHEQPGMKDRAGESVEQGKQAAGDLAATAGEKAGEIKDVTAKQARDVLDEARSQLGKHADEQHRNLVTNLRSLSSEMRDMTNANTNNGVASSLVSQAQGHVDTVADWLDHREPGQLVGELRDFARRRPGVFLAGALAAGVVAGRLTRGAVDAHSDDAATGAPAREGVPQPTVPPIAGQQPGMSDVGLQTDPSVPFVPTRPADLGSQGPAVPAPPEPDGYGPATLRQGGDWPR